MINGQWWSSMACGWANPLKNECSSGGVIIPFLWLKINVSTCFQLSSRTCALNGWKDEKRMRFYFRTQNRKLEIAMEKCGRILHNQKIKYSYVHMKWWPQRNMLIHLCRNFATCHSTMGGKKHSWSRSNRSINLTNLDKQICQQLGWIWVTSVP